MAKVTTSSEELKSISNYNIKQKDFAQFGGRLSNCPPSLKRIVQSYRFGLYSFSGLEFYNIKDENNKSNGSMSLKSWSRIGINLVIMFTYIVPLVYSPLMQKFTKRTVQVEDTPWFGLEQYRDDFKTLKPILRAVMEMVVYVFVIEGFINYLYNLFTGGRMIHLLAQIPGINKIDTSTSYAVRKVATITVAITAVFIAAIVLFNRTQLRILYRLIVDDTFVLEPKMKMDLVKMATYSVMHFSHYFILSLIPLLFHYMMMIFSNAIVGISESSQTVQLNEANLSKIKDKIVTLSEHYKHLLKYFSLPLTLAIGSNVIMLTGSCCYMMIQSNLENDHFYKSFIFQFGLFAFIRLVIVCSVGNMVTNAYRELIRVIFENVCVWQIDEWMCFMEIKRMRSQFKVTVLGTYSLKQSTMLVVLGFSLNYIVVLLQTENYSPDVSSKLDNATTMKYI